MLGMSTTQPTLSLDTTATTTEDCLLGLIGAH